MSPDGDRTSSDEPDPPNPNSLSAQVGQRLRDRRRERNATLVQTAAEAAISPAHLGEIETGESFCSLPVLLRLSRVLDYPVAELLPRIGGHRVQQGVLGASEQPTEVLSHDDLDLDVVGIRLGAGECYQTELDRRQTMLLVVEGDCEMQVDAKAFTLSPGDAVDIVNAARMSVLAQTEVVGLLVRGQRG